MTEAGITVLTGGTDVHLVLVDLRNAEIDGQQAEDRLDAIGITVNRNAVPFDPRPPMVTSGLRIGTPALAARGFGDDDFAAVADLIAEALIAAPSDADADPPRRPGAGAGRRLPALPGAVAVTISVSTCSRSGSGRPVRTPSARCGRRPFVADLRRPRRLDDVT